MNALIRIYKENETFHFRLNARNGEEMFVREEFARLKDCNKAIEAIRHRSQYFDYYGKLETEKGQYHFIIYNDNGHMGAKSHFFLSGAGDSSMRIVRRECPIAKVIRING